jgi:hypothetical protein
MIRSRYARDSPSRNVFRRSLENYAETRHAIQHRFTGYRVVAVPQ